MPCRTKPHRGKVFSNSEFSIPHSELTDKFPFPCSPAYRRSGSSGGGLSEASRSGVTGRAMQA